MMINVKVLSVIVVNVLMTTSDDNYVTEMRRLMIQYNSWLQLLSIFASSSHLKLHAILCIMCNYKSVQIVCEIPSSDAKYKRQSP